MFGVCAIVFSFRPAYALDGGDLSGEKNAYFVYKSCKEVLDGNVSDDAFAETVCYASIQSFVNTVLKMLWYVGKPSDAEKKLLADMAKTVCVVSQSWDFRELAEDYVLWTDMQNMRRDKKVYSSFVNMISLRYNCPIEDNEAFKHFIFDASCCIKDRAYVFENFSKSQRYVDRSKVKTENASPYPKIGTIKADINGDGLLDLLAYIAPPCDICDILSAYVEQPFGKDGGDVLILLQNKTGSYEKVENHGLRLINAQIRIYKSTKGGFQDVGLEGQEGNWCRWTWNSDRYVQSGCEDSEKKSGAVKSP